MLDTIVPRPVTCGGTTVGECTTNGYFVATADGGLYAFGDAQNILRRIDAKATVDPARGVTESRLIAAAMAAGTQVSDIEVTADGRGLWILLTDGRILNLGTATAAPGVAAAQLTDAVAAQAEQVVGLATTRDRDLWVFTSAGRIVPQFGVLPASVQADMDAVLALDLLGPIIAAEPTVDGTGLYAQASDGGVFTYSAPFHGSVYDAIAQARGVPVGSIGPDLPVVGLTVDPDGDGYWVVAADGGIFSLRAPFRGSLPALVPYHQLAAPVNGMVPYGNGYVLIADDGGVFVFSNLPFTGSLAGLTGSKVVDIAAA
jgi:hypothetical protein